MYPPPHIKPVSDAERETLSFVCGSSASGSASNSTSADGSPCVTGPCTLPWVWRQQWRNATCVDELGATDVTHAMTQIIALERSNLPATGNVELTIIGQNFGISDYSSITIVGDTPGQRSEWVSDTSVFCLAQGGERNERVVSQYLCNVCEADMEKNVYVRELFGRTSQVFSYDLPSPAIHTRGSNGPSFAMGFVGVTLSGASFALVDYSPAVRIGSGDYNLDFQRLTSIQMQAALVNANAVGCRTNCRAGAVRFANTGSSGRDESVRVALRGGRCDNNTRELNFSHCLALCSEVDTAAMAAAAQYVADGAVQVEWCAWASGLFPVGLCGQTSSANCVELSQRSSGSLSATAAQGTAWRADTVIAARVSAGVGGTASLTVTVGGQDNTATALFSYDITVLVHELVPPATYTQGNTPGTGRMMSFMSASLGNSDHSLGVRIQPSTAQATSWRSSSCVQARLNHGQLRTRAGVVSVARLAGTRTEGVSYDDVRPYHLLLLPDASFSVTTFTSFPELANTASSLHATVLIKAAALGRVASSSAVLIGLSAAECTQWVSESVVLSRLPLALAPLANKVAITEGMRVATSLMLLSFDALSIAAPVRPQNGLTTGLVAISLTAISAGTHSYSPATRVHADIRERTAGATACASTNWLSHTSLLCHTSQGLHGTASFSSTAGMASSSITEAFTYNVQQVTGSYLANAPLRIHELRASAVVRGLNFGKTAASGQGRVGSSSAESSVWLSDSAVRCFCSRGVATSVTVALTVGERRNTNTETFSYDSVILRDASEVMRLWRNRAAVAMQPITLHGHSMGMYQHTAGTRIGLSDDQATSWSSDSSIAVRVSVSLGASLTARVTAGVRVRASATALFSIDLSLASSIARFNSAGLGQMVLESSSSSITFGLYVERFVDVWTSDMSTYASSAALRIGRTLSQGSQWLSDSSVLTRKPHGVGGSVVLVLTAANTLQSNFALLSYDRPRTRLHRGGSALYFVELSAGFGVVEGWEQPYADGEASTPLLVMNGAATGATTVLLKAAQLAKHHYSPSLRLGVSAAEVTVWTSDTLCTALSPGGHNWMLPIAATLALQVSTLSQVFTFDHPWSLSCLSRTNAPATGSVLVSIQGANFGLALRSVVTRQGVSAAEATVWTSDSTVALRVTVASSLGATAVLAVTSGELRCASLTQTLTFDAPSLLSYRTVEGMPLIGGENWRRNAPAKTPTSSISIHGAFFGLLNLCDQASFGSTGSEASSWASDTLLVCRSTEAVRGSRRVTVTSGLRSFSQSAAVSFDLAGSISAVGSNTCNRAATGSASVTIAGQNFGAAGYTAVARASPTAAEVSNWLSDSEVHSLIAGGGRGSRRISVTVGEHVTSLTGAMSYLASMVSSNRKSNAAATRSASITLAGSLLASVADLSSRARLGSTPPQATQWVSASSILCSPSSSVSRQTVRVGMTTGERGGSTTAAFSVDLGSASGMSPTNLPATGSRSITVIGSNFAAASYSGKFRPAASAAETTRWTSESAVLGLGAAGVKYTHRILVTCHEAAGSRSEAFSYAFLAISRASDRTDCVSKGLKMGLLLLNSSNASKGGDSSGSIPAGFTWLDSSADKYREWRALCGGETFARILEVEYQGSSSFNLYPESRTIDCVCQQSNTTKCNASTANCSCSGKNVSSSSSTSEKYSYSWTRDPSVVTGGSTCRATETRWERRWAPTPSSNQPKYDCRTCSTSHVTVMGAHFAQSDLSTDLRLGFTACRSTDWLSDSAVHARAVYGFGGTRLALLTLFTSIKSASLSDFFSYDNDLCRILHPVNSPLSVTSSTTVVGSNFAAMIYTSSMRHVNRGAGGGAQSMMEATEWRSDSAVAGKRGAFGLRASAGIAITTGEFTGGGSVSVAHSYLLPMMSSMLTTNQPKRLSTQVFGGYWIEGNWMCCEHVANTSLGINNASRCTNVTSPQQKCSNGSVPLRNSAWSPRLIYFQGGLLAKGGSDASFVVMASGAALGVVDSTLAGTLGHTVSEGTGWASDSSVFAQSATMHVRGTRLVLFSVGIQTGSHTEGFSLDSPSASIVLRNNHPGTGALSVTVVGDRFAAACHSTSFRHSGYRASAGEATGWTSDSSVRARSATATSMTRRVSLTAGQRTSSVTEVVSFDLQIRSERGWSDSVSRERFNANVSIGNKLGTLDTRHMTDSNQTLFSAPMRNHPATGSTQVTVSGSAFGLSSYSEMSRTGGSTCEETHWQSDSTIRSRSTGGSFGTRRISVSSCSQVCILLLI